MILVDTSILVDAFTGSRDLLASLTGTVRLGERLGVPALVLYEYLRGPRSEAEIAYQERVFPAHTALPFGPAEAVIAARLYRTLARPRQRPGQVRRPFPHAGAAKDVEQPRHRRRDARPGG